MATSADEFCTLCGQLHITKVAEIWCHDCQDYLCSDCRRPHSVSKLSKRHTSVAIDEYRTIPAYIRSIKHVCMEHDEQFDSFYVSLLEETTLNTLHATKLSSTEQGVHDVREYIQKVKNDRVNNKRKISKQEQSVKEDINKIRRIINDRLDDIEKTTLSELSKVVQTEIKSNDQSINTLDTIETDVTNLSHNVKLLRENATNMQILVGIHAIDTSLVSVERTLETFRKEENTDSRSIIFKAEKIDTILKDVNSLGTLEISKTSSGMDIIETNSAQAQIVPIPSNTHPTVSLKLNETIEIYHKTSCHFICGCTFLANDKLLIGEFTTDGFSNQMILVNKRGYIKRIKVAKGTPIFDIENVSKDGNTVAISTRSNKIFLLNLTNSKMREILVDGDTNGISFHNGTVYCCSVPKGIIRMNIEDESNNAFDLLPFRCGSYSYIAFHNDHLYYTKTETSIECCDTKGNVLWSFEDTNILKQPRGIVVDKNENIFVVGGRSENVVVISADGKSCREVIKYSGLSSPRAIAYDRQYNRLLICNNRSKVFVYNIV
ncbi:unnamed protein product [Mytilus edulis]|uniref:B box-type domain-containing protein n=1 Tax=Mytilus edulis TaxID=6550 RepID=A0A8S3QKU2_MYTED|nr:unnamed protein product [Mytilus edulis]